MRRPVKKLPEMPTPRGRQARPTQCLQQLAVPVCLLEAVRHRVNKELVDATQ